MKLRGAEYIVRILELLEADTLFAYPGGAILPIYDALSETSLKHILVRHEQGAALAANAYGRIKNKPREKLRCEEVVDEIERESE